MLSFKRFFNARQNIIVCLVLLIFTFKCGTNLPVAIDTGMSLWEFILFCITDHYYSVYAWFFFLIFWSLKVMKNKSQLFSVRHLSYKRIYLSHIKMVAISLLFIILLHLLIALVIGITKLGINGGFVATNMYSESGLFELLEIYMSGVKSCVASVLLTAFYMWSGSMVIHLILFFSCEAFEKKGLVLSVVLIIISAMVGFNTTLDDGYGAILFANNWYIFHHGFFVAGSTAFVCVLMFMIAIPIVLLKIALKKKTIVSQTSYFRQIFFVRKKVYIAFLIAIVVMSIVPMLTAEVTGKDILYKVIGGFSYQTFRLTDFLLYISIPVFCLLFINASLEAENNNKTDIAMYRVGSRVNWTKLRGIENKKFLHRFIMSYIVVTGISIMVGIIVLGYPETENVFLMILLSYIFRFFEMFLLYEIDMYLYKITRNSLISFLIAFSVFIPGFIVYGDVFSIFGKGSLIQIAYLCENEKINELIILLIANIAFIAALAMINNKKTDFVIKKKTEKLFIRPNIKKEKVHG